VSVETDLEARAVAFELVENPLSRRPDAAIGLRRVGERVAGLKTFQLAQNRFDSWFGNFRNDFLDQGVAPIACR
jgi:hypothetical protein